MTAPALMWQFETLGASWLAQMFERGGPYAALAVVVVVVLALGKVLIRPVFDWSKEVWARRVSTEDGLRKQMEEVTKRLSKLELFAERVKDEIPEIGNALMDEMDEAKNPTVDRKIIRFYAERLIFFKGVDDGEVA